MTATTRTAPDTAPNPEPKKKLTRSQIAARTAVIATVACICIMWVYAFVFADKSPVAGLNDKAWAKRAEAICVERNAELAENIAAFPKDDADLAAFHDSVARSTDIIEDSLAEIMAVAPPTAEDQGLTNEWARLYRIYISDRRATEARLAAGESVELNETTLFGSPISETITDFTNPNGMQSCAPPVGQ